MKGAKVKYTRDDGGSAIGIVLVEGSSFCLVQGTSEHDKFIEWLPKQSLRAWLVVIAKTKAAA